MVSCVEKEFDRYLAKKLSVVVFTPQIVIKSLLEVKVNNCFKIEHNDKLKLNGKRKTRRNLEGKKAFISMRNRSLNRKNNF